MASPAWARPPAPEDDSSDAAHAPAREGDGGVRIVAGAPTPDGDGKADPDPGPVVPDLGVIRYRDPTVARSLWLGLDVGGVYVPEALGVFDRDAWTLRTVGAWALALTPWLAAGGRHGLVFYDAENIRLQLHEHQLELSGRPMFARHDERLRDRLAVGVEFHTLKRNWVEGEEFIIGGVRDVVLTLGYGMDPLLGERWRLGWNVQGRYVWVFIDQQRQLRASIRPAFFPRPNQSIGLELVGFLVHRDERQFGNPLPRVTVHGQVGLEYVWMSSKFVGFFARLRYMTGFMSGQAPVYEIREEAINASYGEAHVGLRAVWR